MNQTLSKTTRQIPYQDGSVSWHEFGTPRSNALPLILLHGGHGSWEHWIRNTEYLAKYFHVLVPDMPGYGESSLFDTQFQSGILDPLLATINSLLGAEQPVNIAGFSFGSYVATHLAIQRKGINKIALLGTAGHGGPRRPRGELLNWRGLYAKQDWDGVSNIMHKNLYLHMLSAYDRIDALAIRLHQDACFATRFKSRPISRAGGLAELLQEYGGEVLLICGEHDVTCTPEYLVETLVRGHVNRHIELVKDAGHWVQYEKADQVNASLIQWFE
jgi:pimeloyl-ACP methyl ester carboxylesterase